MPVSNVKLCFHIFHLFFFSIHLSMKSITGICQIEIIYRVISNTFAFTHHQLEKIASTFDVDVGQLLLFETTNLNNAVLVGSKRTIYFSTETSKQPIKYLLKYHYFLTIINFLHDCNFVSFLFQLLPLWYKYYRNGCCTKSRWL